MTSQIDLKYTLSICILTMNRKDQVLEAIQSCLDSVLPESTEFVIVDNGSSDGTGDIIKQYFELHPEYDYVYEFQQSNLGVGGGRSRAFEIASGKFLYFLDDDAIIAPESRADFFIKPIEFLRSHSQVASVTTRILDEVVKINRNDNISTKTLDDRPLAFYFLGGSHFLKKSAFAAPLYFPILYGSEELAPSIIAQDKGMVHVYFDDINIVHKPKINKWQEGTSALIDVMIKGIAIKHATKLILYPSIVYPILNLAHYLRCKKYIAKSPGAISRCQELVRETVEKNKHKKIKLTTVFRMYNNFGFSIF